MEQEQAPAAVQPIQAALDVGAENRREQSMSSLLTQMAAAPEAVAQGTAAVEDVQSAAGAESDDAGGSQVPPAAPAVSDSVARSEEVRHTSADRLNESQRRVVESPANQDRQQAASDEQARQTAETRSRAEAAVQAAVGDEFPDALTPGTELHDACAEELAYLRESNSPMINDPQVQYKVARRMARVLGYRRPTEAVAPRRTVRPVPTGGSPVEPPLATLERRVAGAKSPDAMLELMREIGTPFEALLRRS